MTINISSILSNRTFTTWPSWGIIHEWENIIANQLNIPIESSEQHLHFYKKKSISFLNNNRYTKPFHYKDFLKENNKKYLIFEIENSANRSEGNSKNAIPLIIDFWKYTQLDHFYKLYRNCKVIGISSLEVFHYLMQNNCPLPIEHIPLSLPDNYKLDITIDYEKKYDIILAGRINNVLWEYLLLFEKKYPDIEFLYQVQQNNELFYASNKKGVIGNFHTRNDFFSLLKSCKVGFYSTPGMDGGEKRTGGFNPVTPRLLEYMAAQCFLISRYPVNEDTKFYELDRFTKNIKNYESFENELIIALNAKNYPKLIYNDILLKHYTSSIVQKIRKIIE